MRGAPFKAVQELMGHSTIEMTMRYSHLIPDARREAVRLLDLRESATLAWITSKGRCVRIPFPFGIRPDETCLSNAVLLSGAWAKPQGASRAARAPRRGVRLNRSSFACMASVKAALEQSEGNKSRAAKLLGLPSRQTLNNRMRSLGLVELGT
jgi:DNA-binding NtrC family response regulator